MNDTTAIDRINAILYPRCDYNAEWTADEIELIAQIIEQVRPKPDLLVAYGYTEADSTTPIRQELVNTDERDTFIDANPAGIWWSFSPYRDEDDALPTVGRDLNVWKVNSKDDFQTAVITADTDRQAAAATLTEYVDALLAGNMTGLVVNAYADELTEITKEA